MISYIDKGDCYGCLACSQICPMHCIKMTQDKEGFLYPEVNIEKCINCGLCEKTCPSLKEVKFSKAALKTIAAKNRDADQRKSASSGGVFGLLATDVIKCGGVVVGAAYNVSRKEVEHICVEDTNKLVLLSGSKYSQSMLQNALEQMGKSLKEGKQVLFSGTPCQVAGVKQLFGNQQKNLITIDLVCHGVPSPKIFNAYLTEIEHNMNSPINSINLVDKEGGWHSRRVTIRFDNGKCYQKKQIKDPFMRAFSQDLINRPSCAKCQFKNYNYYSDITIGDFWGIEKICPHMDDNKGTSLVILRTEKGEQLFSKIKNKTECIEVDYNKAIEGNPAIRKPYMNNAKRELFFERMDSEPYNELVFSLLPIDSNIFHKMRRKLVNIRQNRVK